MELPAEKKAKKFVRLVECPRDAMQGWKENIPTSRKVEYINSLLEVGFDIIDFGSFVSARTIPQMADTPEVLKALSWQGKTTRLLVIVANLRGAEEASRQEGIAQIGFPFSVSETFQHRNTNRSIDQSLAMVGEMQANCMACGKELVIYISMGFGNPYGDPYSARIVLDWVRRICQLGVRSISLADTVGLATPTLVAELTSQVVREFPGQEVGVHLHSSKLNWKEKLDAAIGAGAARFDGALRGIGGCPMANDELVGNLDTALMIPYLDQLGVLPGLNKEALRKSLQLADAIFV
jgi:hydroxymethylglutaryl-CoA lyase